MSNNKVQENKKCLNVDRKIAWCRNKLDEIGVYMGAFSYTLVSDSYKNNKIKLETLCPNGHRWFVRWSDFRVGKRCPCETNNMPITKEVVIEVLKVYGFDLVSDTYVDNKTPIKIRCTHGHTTEMSYSHFYNRPHCSECWRKTLPTYSKIKEHFVVMGYTLLSDNYVGSKKLLRYKCKEGHINYMSWNNFSRKYRCPDCANNALLTIPFLREEFGKRGYTLNSDIYEGNKKKLDCTCPLGHKWSVSWNCFNRPQECPRCNRMSSKPEREIRDFVISLLSEEEVICNDRETIGPYELDIFIPAKKVAIEFCGLYYHSEVSGGKTNRYHYDKMVACNQKGIRLLVVFEDEYTNRKEVVLSRIQNAIGVGLKRVYARQCEIREIDSKTANAFLLEFHLQGKSNSTKRWGLYYKDLLVAVLTAGYPARAHTSGGKRVLEIKRFASRGGYSIVGGASKLFGKAKQFAIEQDFEVIKSYCDRRYESLTPVYEQLGLVMQTYTKYTPHYISPDYKVRVRNQGLRKTPEERLTGKSEWGLRREQGYDRIFDCGHRTYVMEL